MNTRPVFAVFDEREGIYKYLMKGGEFESRETADRKEIFLFNEIQASFTVFMLDQAVGKECFGYMQIVN